MPLRLSVLYVNRVRKPPQNDGGGLPKGRVPDRPLMNGESMDQRRAAPSSRWTAAAQRRAGEVQPREARAMLFAGSYIVVAGSLTSGTGRLVDLLPQGDQLAPDRFIPLNILRDFLHTVANRAVIPPP